MRFALLAAALPLALAACSSQEETAVERVENAWVRLAAIEDRPAAAYFEINGAERADTLIAIDSPAVATVELHETVREGERMSMRPLDAVEVPEGETVTFEPGGRHAMLFGVDSEVTPGTPLVLNFRFDSGRDVRVEAITVAAGDPSPFEPAE